MRKQKQLTGYHVLAMVVAFFTVIISVNFTMAWLASSSWTGLVVKNSYVASQGYNEKLSAARQQKARGWGMSIGYRKPVIEVSVRDKNNSSVIFEKLVLKIGRPASQFKDIEVGLTYKEYDEHGIYEAPIELAAGVWTYELNSDGDNSYYIEGRISISKAGVGTMQ